MSKDFIHQELEVAQAGADIKEGSRGGRIGKILTTSFFSASILMTVCAVVFTIIFFVSEVVGCSMMLTLNPSYRKIDNENVRDSVLVNKFIEPKRGDVIVLKHTWGATTSKAGETEYFIKRLIAVGGDRVHFNRYHGTYETPGDICDDPTCLLNHPTYKTVVNDQEINEWYLDKVHWGKMRFYGANIYAHVNGKTRPYTTNDFVPFFNRSIHINEDETSPSYGKYEIFIKSGEIFFMGDNRGGDSIVDWNNNMFSYDCTSFGPQPRSVIEGVSVNIIRDDESIPQYIWEKTKQFFSFKWLF